MGCYNNLNARDNFEILNDMNHVIQKLNEGIYKLLKLCKLIFVNYNNAIFLVQHALDISGLIIISE